MHIPRHPDRFVDRHIGPDTRDVMAMLQVLGRGSLDALIDELGILRCVGHGATKRSISRNRYLAAKNSIGHDFRIATWHFAVGILSSFEDLHVT